VDVTASIVGCVVVERVTQKRKGSRKNKNQNDDENEEKVSGSKYTYHIRIFRTALRELSLVMFRYAWFTLCSRKTPFHSISVIESGLSINTPLTRMIKRLQLNGADVDIVNIPNNMVQCTITNTDGSRENMHRSMNVKSMGVYASAGAVCSASALTRYNADGMPIAATEEEIKKCRKQRKTLALQRSAQVGPQWFDHYHQLAQRRGAKPEQRAQYHSAMLLAYPEQYRMMYPQQWAMMTSNQNSGAAAMPAAFPLPVAAMPAPADADDAFPEDEMNMDESLEMSRSSDVKARNMFPAFPEAIKETDLDQDFERLFEKEVRVVQRAQERVQQRAQQRAQSDLEREVEAEEEPEGGFALGGGVAPRGANIREMMEQSDEMLAPQASSGRVQTRSRSRAQNLLY